MHHARIGLAVLLSVSFLQAQVPADTSTNGSKAAAPERHLLAEGQVFNHIGAGVPNATVTLKQDNAAAAIATTTTNELGDFRLYADRKITGPATVEFTKEHHKTISREIELGRPDGPPFVDVEMTGDLVLRGKVVDARDEKPVKGANVLIEAGYKEWTADTDSNGTFAIEGLFPGPADLRVDADGYARCKSKIERAEEATDLTLKLSPERIAHLRVVDESGKELAGVGVEIVEEASADYRHLLTGTNGIATFRRLPFEAPSLQVRLSHEAYVSSPEFDRTVELPTDKAESTHDLVMQQAGFLVGTVVDATTREPLLGARLTVGSFLDDRLPRGWSEFDGSYRITGIPPGEAVVTVHLSGYAPELATAQVEAGKEQTLSVKMAAPRNVAGTVAGPDGKPVPGAYISATKWREHETLGLRAMSNPAGAFEIIDAPADAFEVSVYAPGFNPLVDQQVPVGSEPLAFKLTVDERANATGSAPKLATGSDAPAFDLTTLGGEKITSESVKGKVVLLDFWATWCGPCVMEIPHLREVYESFGTRKDFVMVSVSLDDDASALGRFVTQRKMNWNQVCGEKNGARKASDDFGVAAIPAIFIIDREGKMAAQNLRGTQTAQKLAEMLKEQ